MDYSKGAEWRRWDLHLHTSSSYDYQYKGEDADDVLVKALRDNEISAVAITDHFLIDSNRILHLRSLAPEIVFFPGVELRTDKGANNLHVILIFSEQEDVESLANRFNVIMRGQKAKCINDNDRVYWDYNDVVQFAEEEDALISIHAGRKTAGVDKEIRSESYPYKDAIKDEIGQTIHFFDMGQKRDFDDYRKYVFPEIGEKPMIICSDNHDARNYAPSESLWIKADCTFEGLKQCVFQPEDRVFVGVIPPSLDRVNKNKRNTISKLSISRVPQPKHVEYEWFKTDIELNPNLVAVIGNKGSGKSALSDIVGHLCKCHTMDQASFLSDKRFKNPKTRYADDYQATITWLDGHIESRVLGEANSDSSIETAQYLPQAYIENVCNDIGDVFQKEINKVIFSYVDPIERGTATNLVELVENKTYDIKAQQSLLIDKLHILNADIIKLESKKTKDYKKKIEEGEEKLAQDLSRHEKNKPIEVKKPEVPDRDVEYQRKLEEINNSITILEDKKNNCLVQIALFNDIIESLMMVIVEMETLGKRVDEVNVDLHQFVQKYSISDLPDSISYGAPLEQYKAYLKSKQEQRDKLYEEIKGSDATEGLEVKISALKESRARHIESGDANEKKYQKYLLDMQEWEEQKKKLIGDETTLETLAYYQKEKDYIENVLEVDYAELTAKRAEMVLALYQLRHNLIETYNSIYEPIQSEIQRLLKEIEEKITFKAEIQLTDDNFVEKTLSFISQRFSGLFKGKIESRENMNQIVNSTIFDSYESVCTMLDKVLKGIGTDFDTIDKQVQDRQGFYDFLFGLSYIGVDFKLKVGDRELAELSPGERGIVLLIFYLALSKESTPIFVDQPEDNLDNQSVFANLVPCINAAKEKRQVIIVTHNPNIAVACDAEQIIYCEMNKEKYQIKYSSGSIENMETRNHVVDVLEGTMPAFELRRKKYFEKTN